MRKLFWVPLVLLAASLAAVAADPPRKVTDWQPERWHPTFDAEAHAGPYVQARSHTLYDWPFIDGHDSDVAGSQAEALRYLKTDTYAYVLSDIRIRARARNGRPRIQNLENFLERLGKLKCPPPVIVISDYAARGLKETVDVMRLAIGMDRRAPVDFVVKPLDEKGRTLDRVIKKLLAGTMERVRINWPAEEAPRAKAAPSGAAPTETAGDTSTGEIVTLDEFMARYCEPRSRQVRRCRRKALLAAARHGSIGLPALAAERKHGHPAGPPASGSCGRWGRRSRRPSGKAPAWAVGRVCCSAWAS